MKRILTALLLLPLVIYLILEAPRFLVWLVATLASHLGWYEYAQMTNLPPDLFVAGGFALLFLLFSFLFPGHFLFALWLTLFLLGLYFLRHFAGYEFIILLGLSLAGLVYLAVGFGHLFALLDLPEGRLRLLILLGIVFGTDTGAYYTGKTLGRHRLIPRVSPKKTWEGSLGGTILGVFLGLFLTKLFHLSFSPFLIVFYLAVSIIGQLGDLFESMIKRACQVKDSGTILPGHGGLLDRVDALIFAAPFYFWGLKLVLFS